MRIEINPKSLQNLEQICEVLYKLHPSVLYDLNDMEERLGKLLGENKIIETFVSMNVFVTLS